MQNVERLNFHTEHENAEIIKPEYKMQGYLR
jgi:hypothetical protein